MSEFEALLELSDLDTHISQLHHRRANDPLHAAIAQADTEGAAIDLRRSDAQARRDVVRRDQGRLEDEAASFGEKIAKFEGQLYDGSVTAHKELESIQAEIAHLGERKSAIEDDVLVQMELAEPIDAELADLAEQAAAAAAERERLARDLTILEAEIDADLLTSDELRADLVSKISDSLLATYEEVRTRLVPAAVRLAAGGRCEGCHLSLPRADYDSAKRAPADAVVECPECGRILVR